jgi:alpha-1,4-digalacturonate transport system permease protein
MRARIDDRNDAEAAHKPWLLQTGCYRALGRLAGAVNGLADRPLRLLQAIVGERRMAYFFLSPNLCFFSLFVFLPVIINFIYSFTGGAALFSADRPFVGTEQYAVFPICHQVRVADHFWRGVTNTLEFTMFQVVTMVVVSLVTAVILNMKVRGRGFFRAVFLFPVLLSPVVVVLIWKWILQRDGLPNAGITALGGQKILFFVDPNWAMFWAVFVSIWAHMGFYTLILLAGLQTIPAVTGVPASDRGLAMVFQSYGDPLTLGVRPEHISVAVGEEGGPDYCG